MTKIKLGPKLLLTDAIVAQHMAVLGKTRSGKSSVLRLFVEALLDRGERVCIIDPKGDWWGIKSSKSGKQAGHPLVIFGGDRGDVPLNAHAGKSVAELVAADHRPCLIDLGGWTVGDRTRLFIDFAQSLFRHVVPHLWLVIDEVHNFAPQGKVADPQAGQMLHWANRLASEGAGKGIVVFSASQRPQKVHKDFLTCAETLVAMRVIHPLDRKALKEWIDGCPDAGKGTEVLESLANMRRGEGWLWSPEAEFGPRRIAFPLFKTFDSFAPQGAQTRGSLKGWASVDLEKVTEHLASLIDEQKANDPRELKKRIRDLEKQLAASQPVIDQQAISRAVDERDRQWTKAVEEYESIRQQLENKLNQISELSFIDPSGQITAYSPPSPAHSTNNRPKVSTKTNGERVSLRAGARRMMEALGRSHPATLTVSQWATLSRLKPRGGTWSTYLSDIRRNGFIIERGREVSLSDAGLDWCGDLVSASPMSGSDARAMWREKLRRGACMMLDELVAAHPTPLTRNELADRVGLASDGGTFSTYVSDLTRNGLAERVASGELMATDVII